MNIETLRLFCLNFKGVTEGFPFDEETLVFKVGEKMFALVKLDGPLGINLKCNPQKAIELRDRYPTVTPGYHMNKNHWNTVLIDGSIHSNIIKEWITESYNLVFSSLPKKKQLEILDKQL